MIFNSVSFFIFFAVVFVLYWRLSHSLQNRMLLLASYIFYGWWDWRFLSLILISTCVDYGCALGIEKVKTEKSRKIFLLASLLVNLGLLGFFKYFNFFAASFYESAQALGFSFHPASLNIILPIGISFYTFQTMSYTIEVYRRNQKPTRNFIEFALYVSFFPQLVAGPIERPANMLPQYREHRVFDYDRVVGGFKLMAWGLFQKMIIADHLAKYVDAIYAEPSGATGVQLFLATFFFAFQIFCDFSGYTDIAIGGAQVLGFKLMRNFRQPYFATSLIDFWRRWHISLSTWFRDYVYIPLGGNRGGTRRLFVSVMATFLLSGLWHGANWTFVFWGLIHGLLIFLLMVSKDERSQLSRLLGMERFKNLKHMLNIFLTFFVVLTTWVFFRAQSLQEAFFILSSMYRGWNLQFFINEFNSLATEQWVAVMGIFLLLTVHFMQIKGLGIREILSRMPLFFRWAFYYLGITILWFFSFTEPKHFIYFQF